MNQLLRIYFMLILAFLSGFKCCQAAAFSPKADSLMVYHKGIFVFIRHKVSKNETITSLSQDFKTPIARLMDLNKIDYSTQLNEGQEVKIPIGSYNLMLQDQKSGQWLYYKVQSGEELNALSHLFNVPVNTLKKWNSMKYDGLFSGQVLKIRPPDPSRN